MNALQLSGFDYDPRIAPEAEDESGQAEQGGELSRELRVSGLDYDPRIAPAAPEPAAPPESAAPAEQAPSLYDRAMQLERAPLEGLKKIGGYLGSVDAEHIGNLPEMAGVTVGQQGTRRLGRGVAGIGEAVVEKAGEVATRAADATSTLRNALSTLRQDQDFEAFVENLQPAYPRSQAQIMAMRLRNAPELDAAVAGELEKATKYAERHTQGAENVEARAEEVRDYSDKLKTEIEALQPRVDELTGDSPLMQDLATVGQSVPTMAAGFGIAALAGPAAGAAVMGGTAGGNQYSDDRRAGYDREDALVGGVIAGVSETIGEKTPLKFLTQKLGISRAKRFFSSVLSDSVGEGVTETLNILGRYGYFDEEVPIDEAIERIAHAFRVGAVGGTVFGAGAAVLHGDGTANKGDSKKDAEGGGSDATPTEPSPDALRIDEREFLVHDLDAPRAQRAEAFIQHFDYLERYSPETALTFYEENKHLLENAGDGIDFSKDLQDEVEESDDTPGAPERRAVFRGLDTLLDAYGARRGGSAQVLLGSDRNLAKILGDSATPQQARTEALTRIANVIAETSPERAASFEMEATALLEQYPERLDEQAEIAEEAQDFSEGLGEELEQASLEDDTAQFSKEATGALDEVTAKVDADFEDLMTGTEAGQFSSEVSREMEEAALNDDIRQFSDELSAEIDAEYNAEVEEAYQQLEYEKESEDFTAETQEAVDEALLIEELEREPAAAQAIERIRTEEPETALGQALVQAAGGPVVEEPATEIETAAPEDIDTGAEADVAPTVPGIPHPDGQSYQANEQQWRDVVGVSEQNERDFGGLPLIAKMAEEAGNDPKALEHVADRVLYTRGYGKAFKRARAVLDLMIRKARLANGVPADIRTATGEQASTDRRDLLLGPQFPKQSDIKRARIIEAFVAAREGPREQDLALAREPVQEELPLGEKPPRYEFPEQVDDNRQQRVLNDKGTKYEWVKPSSPLAASLPPDRTDNFRTLFDPRLKRRAFRDQLWNKSTELQVNGGVAYLEDENGRIVGRTSSQNPPWFQNMGWTKKRITNAIDALFTGRRLGSEQQVMIQTMLEDIHHGGQDPAERRQAAQELWESRDTRHEVSGRMDDIGMARAGHQFVEDQYIDDDTPSERAVYELGVEASAANQEAFDEIPNNYDNRQLAAEYRKILDAARPLRPDQAGQDADASQEDPGGPSQGDIPQSPPVRQTVEADTDFELEQESGDRQRPLLARKKKKRSTARRTTRPRGGSLSSDVKAALAPKLKTHKAPVKVNVVQSHKDLPAELQADLKSRGVTKIEALFDPTSGEVYVVADNIRSPEHAQRVVLGHELRHAGLRRVLGTKLNAVLEAAYAGNKSAINELAADYKLDTSKRGDRLEATEEYIVEMAERGETNNIIQKVYAQIKDYLRRRGWDLELTDVDLRLLVAQAGKQIEAGKAWTPRGMIAQGERVEFYHDANTGRALMARARAEPEYKGKEGFTRKNWDNFRKVNQDRFLEGRHLQDWLVDRNGPIPQDQNFSDAEDTFHDASGFALEELERRHTTPLRRVLVDSGITSKQAGEFLHARHALEVNADLAARNKRRYAAEDAERKVGDAWERMSPAQRKKRTDEEEKVITLNDPRLQKLSGMSNGEALVILQRWAGNPQMQDIAQRIDNMTALNRQRLLKGGLISKAEKDAWEKTNTKYVPLLRDFDDMPLPTTPVGQGYVVRGSGYKHRVGSNKDVDHESILPGIVAQSQAGIVRTEKNKVMQQLHRLAEANPDPGYWETGTEFTAPRRDPKTGNTRETNITQEILNSDDAVVATFNGVPSAIWFHTPEGQRFSKNLRAINDRQLKGILKFLAGYNRYQAAVNTSYSIPFGPVNYVRDFKTALINMQGTEADKLGIITKVLLDAAPAGKAMRGMVRYMKSEGQDTEGYAGWYQDFRAHGGGMSWSELYRDLDEAKVAFEENLFFDATKGVGWKETKRGFQRKWRAFTRFVDAANRVIENAVRLSLYKHLVESETVPKQRAAAIAKNLTINFSRRGEIGKEVNATWLFYNASMQGGTNTVTNAQRPKVQKILAASAVTAVGWTLAMRLMAGEDDEGINRYDKIPDYVRAHNIVVWIPGQGDSDNPKEGEHYLTMPLPYGYNAVWSLGETMADPIAAALGMKRDFRPMESAARLANSIYGGFSPVQGGSVVQLLTPTIADPLVQIAENKDHAGRPLNPPEQPFAKPPPPNYTRHWSQTSPHLIGMAEMWNKLGGGNEAVGAKHWFFDVTPETVELLQQTLTGSMGQFFVRLGGLPSQMEKAEVLGESLESRKVPLLRRFKANTSPYFYQSLFYDAISDLERAEAQIESTDPDTRATGLAMPIAPMAGMSKRYRKDDAKYGKKLRAIEKDPNLTDMEKLVLEDRVRTNRLAMQRAFIKRWMDVVHPP